MTSPLHDNSLVIDTRRLVRRPGTMVEEQFTAPAPADFGTDVLAVPAGDPLDIELRLESVMEGVLASGTVRATATGACVRCLENVEDPIDVEFQELFAYPDRAAHHREVGDEEDDDEYVLGEGDTLDLEPVLRDAVVPTLPFQPVCDEDCPGLCSECGARLADDPTHQHEILDPRWAALRSLTGDETEEKRN
ncbi:YceD family protein [Mobilicoccus massiliensis]|uniref:YceD family protein n=1 Tax=Mobilicoccus massiliensis TaxID=1522310 RepID=UPI00058F833A|nr:YceD family protein [Mobilicoccus massiliensis]